MIHFQTLLNLLLVFKNLKKFLNEYLNKKQFIKFLKEVLVEKVQKIIKEK